MSKAGRQLQVGDYAVTDFNGNGLTLVQITNRFLNVRCQSKILFCVYPPLKGGTDESMYDADWFEPAPKDML